MPIKIKRIYEAPSPGDGYRILVDRLWPRGVSKEDAQLDEWMKEIAPSHDLRKWFHHESGSFEEFTDRYKEELKDKKEELKHLLDLAESVCDHKPVITLLYASRDKEHNHAFILKELLESIN